MAGYILIRSSAENDNGDFFLRWLDMQGAVSVGDLGGELPLDHAGHLAVRDESSSHEDGADESP